MNVKVSRPQADQTDRRRRIGPLTLHLIARAARTDALEQKTTSFACNPETNLSSLITLPEYSDHPKTSHRHFPIKSHH